MMTDIEINNAATLQPITEIAAKLGIDDVIPYGKLMAKVPAKNELKGKLILVTAINPTPAGEGKTTTSIGLADSLRAAGYNACLALREPSLGPVFGVKGGATGGGFAQVAPMENINLHFTGDFHAIENANNLLAAMIDNHIFQGNALGIDPAKVTWKRCMDMNDRQLRKVKDGLEDLKSAVRIDGFDITVASEVMAIFCLAESFDDLRERLGKIIIGYTFDDKPVTAHDLKAEGAMLALLKDAFDPNLVQTLEGTPAFIHGGPFANIAHGCNSVVATKTALSYADYVVTEAGFGADLGAEKFMDIKCRMSGLKPNAIVLVATARALKYNGGVAKEDLKLNNKAALEKGICNLIQHINNLKKFNIPVMVAINRFDNDYEDELTMIRMYCDYVGVPCAMSDIHAKGSKGGQEMVEKLMQIIDDKELMYIYNTDESIVNKITKVAHSIYRASSVKFTNEALESIARIEAMGYTNTPVCVAKTQYSFSDDPSKLGAPQDYEFTVRDVRLSAGAGFVVAISGKIMTMPGLPKVPAAESIDVVDGKIVGLF